MVARDKTSGERATEKESRRSKPGKRTSDLKVSDRKSSAREKSEDLQLTSIGELESLKQRLGEEEARSREYLNKLLYAQADFENYRKRLNQEVDSRIEAWKTRMIQDLLTVADELELGLDTAKDTENARAVTHGLEMVLNKLRNLLVAEGLAPVESLGSKFDPALHEAVQRVETADVEEGTIVEEVRRGFTLKGKLIRPSIVKIAVHQVTKPEKKESEQSK